MTTDSFPPSQSPGSARGRSVRILPFAALVAASLLGAGAAIGGAAAIGAFDGATTTTVVERQAPSATQIGEGLTVGEIYRREGSGVVQVTTQTANGSGLGSGFVVDTQGHIVTNYHVIDGADQIEVSFSNKDTLPATLVGTDQSTDLAVLEVDAGADALTPLALADSDAVQVGDPVVAIGNPFGLERTVTTGIVSALQRAVRAPNGYTIDEVIQTDAAINKGNSGGPLLDMTGEVIGVNSQIETSGGSTGNVGIGFAVPSNTVRMVLAQILEDGKVSRAYLGVSLSEVAATQAAALGVSRAGLLVQTVQSDSPAARAGVRAGTQSVVVAGESYVRGGDLIVAIDGVAVETIAALREQLAQHRPGEKVVLDVVRGGATKTLTVTLDEQPATLAG